MKNYKDCVKVLIEGYMCAVIGERLITDNVSKEDLDETRHVAEKCIETSYRAIEAIGGRKECCEDKIQALGRISIARYEKPIA